MKLLQHTYILLSVVSVLSIFQLAKISEARAASTRASASEKTLVITDSSFDEEAPALYYSESDNSWSFSVRVLETRTVSIYGRPGSIARIEYLHRGEVRDAWVVIKIDDYSFSDSTIDISVGDQISLRVSGDDVSSKGVDWSVCPL